MFLVPSLRHFTIQLEVKLTKTNRKSLAQVFPYIASATHIVGILYDYPDLFSLVLVLLKSIENCFNKLFVQ